MSVWAELAAVVVFTRQLQHINPLVDALLPFYLALVLLVLAARARSPKQQREDVLERIVRQNLSAKRSSAAAAAAGEEQSAAVDLTGKPDFSGFWKRTHSEGEDELMAAQGVPWALRKLAMAGDTYQKLTQKPTGLAIKQIRAGRELNWEYFYGKSVPEDVPVGDGHYECEIFWEDNVLIVTKYNPVKRLRFVGTRELSPDGNTIRSLLHVWTKVDREGEYYRGEGRKAMTGPFESHVTSVQIMERVPEPK